MGKRKKATEEQPSNASMKVAIQPSYAEAVRRWIDGKPEQSYTTVVNQAVREFLEKHGFWPPPQSPASDSR